MSIPVRISCPSCGGEQFALDSEAKSYEDYVGAPCAACGHKITDDEVKGQVVEAARKHIEKLLKD